MHRKVRRRVEGPTRADGRPAPIGTAAGIDPVRPRAAEIVSPPREPNPPMGKEI